MKMDCSLLDTRMSGTQSVRELENATLIFSACIMLEQAGFLGSWSAMVQESLAQRLEMVEVRNLSPHIFFRPVSMLVHRGSSGPDTLAKREQDVKMILAVIKSANGDLHQMLIAGR